MNELDIIRKASKKKLLDREWLEDAIAKLGIYERDGMIPSHLLGNIGGIRAAQWPCQVAPYLIFMADKEIKSYAEIGILFGGMFRLTIEYLERFNLIEKAMAVDINMPAEMFRDHEPSKITLITKIHRDHEPGEIILVNDWSYSETVKDAFKKYGPFDLVLIDSTHDEESVRKDYELVKDHAKYIAFHDISEFSTPGVRKVFDSIWGEKVEFIEQYDEILAAGRTGYGLGVIFNDQLRTNH